MLGSWQIVNKYLLKLNKLNFVGWLGNQFLIYDIISMVKCILSAKKTCK